MRSDAPRDWVGSPVLVRSAVTLRLVQPADLRALWSVTPPDTFRYYPSLRPEDPSWEAFEAFGHALLSLSDNAAFLVLDGERVVGCSSMMDLRPYDRGVEVGRTWYSEEARGTHVNPTAKLLLFGHAFDTMDAVRVQLKTDARNERSRRAILKAGAKFEGILRRHLLTCDGNYRDTAMYSVIREEWPEVRDALIERLRGFEQA
ncbi:MAG: hypothetical protein AMXMBFR81_14590 [Chthonomonas sp.]